MTPPNTVHSSLLSVATVDFTGRAPAADKRERNDEASNSRAISSILLSGKKATVSDSNEHMQRTKLAQMSKSI